MHDGTIIWMAVLAVFGATFFLIAAYVAVTGVADVRALLTRHRTGSPDPERS